MAVDSVGSIGNYAQQQLKTGPQAGPSQVAGATTPPERKEKPGEVQSGQQQPVVNAQGQMTGKIVNITA
jgi:hypothetical protein